MKFRIKLPRVIKYFLDKGALDQSAPLSETPLPETEIPNKRYIDIEETDAITQYLIKELGGKAEAAQKLAEMANAIPSIRNNKTVDTKAVQIDCAALLVLLHTCGYTPLKTLELISKMFGSIIGCMPTHVVDETGKPLTPEMVEAEFLRRCAQERMKYRKINDELFRGQPVIDKRRLN